MVHKRVLAFFFMLFSISFFFLKRSFDLFFFSTVIISTSIAKGEVLPEVITVFFFFPPFFFYKKKKGLHLPSVSPFSRVSIYIGTGHSKFASVEE